MWAKIWIMVREEFLDLDGGETRILGHRWK